MRRSRRDTSGWADLARQSPPWVAGASMIFLMNAPGVAATVLTPSLPGPAAAAVRLACAAPAMALVAWFAPLASYRRRDCLFVLVPLWNVGVAWRIGTRLTRLPARDWRPRSDEGL